MLTLVPTFLCVQAVAPAFAAPSKQQRYLAQENTLQEARRSACAGLDLPFQSRSHGLIGSFIDLAAAQGRLALKKAYSGASLVSLRTFR